MFRDKKLKRRDLEKLLKEVHSLNPELRGYVHSKLLGREGDYALDKRKISKKLLELKRDKDSKLNRYMHSKVEDAVMGHFEDPEQETEE